MSSRPGGGLGPPSDAPDPLQNVRWWILGGFVLVLAGGGYYVIQRNKNAPTMAATAGGGSMPVPPITSSYTAPVTRVADTPRLTTAATQAAPTVSSSSSAGVLMQAMKEELFQLEIDRHQGAISPEEYKSTKAALDQTLARAIQRESRRS